jgi:hypothetical protein
MESSRQAASVGKLQRLAVGRQGHDLPVAGVVEKGAWAVEREIE